MRELCPTADIEFAMTHVVDPQTERSKNGKSTGTRNRNNRS